MKTIPKTNGERDADDERAVLMAIWFGNRRAAKIQTYLGWPDEARYSRLNSALQRLRKAAKIEYRATGWHTVKGR